MATLSAVEGLEFAFGPDQNLVEVEEFSGIWSCV